MDEEFIPILEILKELKKITKNLEKLTTKENTSEWVEAADMAIEALEQEPILDKIKAEIGMYEADCRLQGGTDECEKCNSNIFGSIYRIIDKYRAESEE